MSYLRPFDPWRSEFCSCPEKWTVNPYTGCGHRCLYCYATSFIPRFYEPRPKRDFLKTIEREIPKLPEGALISLSNSSDPYQPLEEKLRLTRSFLEMVQGLSLYLLILTKSDLILRDLDLLSPERTVVSVTLTTRKYDRILEPGAPGFEKRLSAIKELKKRGFKTVARIDPLIPFLNESELEEIVSEVSPYVDHIVVSTYKARKDSLNRLGGAFPELAPLIRDLYQKKGLYQQNSYYLQHEIRRNLLYRAKTLCLKYGKSLGICREGIRDLQEPEKCDGSFLLKQGWTELTGDTRQLK